MSRSLVLTLTLMMAGTLGAQQAPPPSAGEKTGGVAKPSAFTMNVGLAVDAPPEMQWVLVDQLTRRLKNTQNVSYAEKNPDWVITVVAFDPFPDEKDPKKKQYAMSTAFLQQLTWIDPELLETVRKDPCVPTEKFDDYAKSQRTVGDLFTMGTYAGNVAELKSTANDVIDDFVRHVLEPAKINYESVGARSLQQRMQRPMQMHQTERPKNWPPVPPIRKP